MQRGGRQVARLQHHGQEVGSHHRGDDRFRVLSLKVCHQGDVEDDVADDRMDDGVAIAVAMGAAVAVLAWAAIAAKVAARFTNWLAPTSPDSSGATGGAASVKTKAMPGRTDWRVL